MSEFATFDSFERYSRALIASKDVDPTYPVVRWIIDFYGFNGPWFIFCYGAFYSLDSAIRMCRAFPTPESFDEEAFRHIREHKTINKFGHERRGSCRNPNNQVGLFRDAISFINRLDQYKDINNTQFRTELKKLSFQGEWASYKIAELFEKSLGYTSLTIPDLGLEGKDPNRNDGPVGGLRWLYGREHKYSTEIYPTWNRFGEELAKGWGVGMGEVETCLCKWHKMCSGKYWIGHDIAEFVELEQVIGEGDYKQMMTELFNPVMWHGIYEFPKHLKSAFAKQGHMENEIFSRKYPEIDVYEILMKTT